VNGRFKNNAAEAGGGFSYNVCEHAYRVGTSETTSDRCANGYVDSECDLTHRTAEQSGHAGNNAALKIVVWGYTTGLEIECT
jgi:hypothetical protein